MKAKRLLLVIAGLMTGLAHTSPCQAQTNVTTKYIDNPNFEARFAGWVNENMSYNTSKNFAGQDGMVFMEKWVASGNKLGSTGSIHQVLEGLPVGTYTLTANAHNIQQGKDALQTGAFLYGGNEQTEVNQYGEYSVTFTTVTGTADVGFRLKACTGNWACVDNFQLYYEGVKKDSINMELQKIIDDRTDPWGIKVTRVELKNILPPDEIRHAMEKEMKAERDRRQTILEAEGHKQAVITRAEGDKQAKLLAAEAERDAQIALAQGRAQSIKLVYEAEAQGLRMLSAADPTEQVIKLKGLEALKNVADGRATKIYMPSDIAGAISTIGVIGESLGIGDHIPVDTSERPAAQIKEDPCIKPETGEGGIDAYAATEAINIDVETDRFKGIAGYDYQAAPEQ